LEGRIPTIVLSVHVWLAVKWVSTLCCCALCCYGEHLVAMVTVSHIAMVTVSYVAMVTDPRVRPGFSSHFLSCRIWPTCSMVSGLINYYHASCLFMCNCYRYRYSWTFFGYASILYPCYIDILGHSLDMPVYYTPVIQIFLDILWIYQYTIPLLYRYSWTFFGYASILYPYYKHLPMTSSY
jgi:hypothetical protein